ncbi:hypothetical protein RclHR1_02010002 [Rhizophagus clarus]|uniref:BED-type domain-containing protein n=1 Tax=Rhizophagus clarus TaxID=94130 RepID=A0A2Z6QST2_9GLOM|nr:hypothetical protein RclHR1_02010002 [Rhizophagus clarus]GET03288.1 hypothetical protein GLOIN_2v1786327 [Rhizophagus clarus]
MPRERKHAAWAHFYIISKNKDPHPHVQCKYCIKEYKRAVPERMQDHLDKKCSEAPNDAKSHGQNRNDRLSKEELNSLVSLLAKLLSIDHSSTSQILKNMVEQNETKLCEEVNIHPNQELSTFSFVERPYTLTRPIMLSPSYDSITRNTLVPLQEFSCEYDHETTQQFYSELEYLNVDQQKLRDVNNRHRRSNTKKFFNKRYNYY